jgi:hypothetical protein
MCKLLISEFECYGFFKTLAAIRFDNDKESSHISTTNGYSTCLKPKQDAYTDTPTFRNAEITWACSCFILNFAVGYNSFILC